MVRSLAIIALVKEILEMEQLLIPIGETVLEIVGLGLLAREVYLGQQMEEVTAGLEVVRQLQFLWAR